MQKEYRFKICLLCFGLIMASTLHADGDTLPGNAISVAFLAGLAMLAGLVFAANSAFWISKAWLGRSKKIAGRALFLRSLGMILFWWIWTCIEHGQHLLNELEETLRGLFLIFCAVYVIAAISYLKSAKKRGAVWGKDGPEQNETVEH